MDTAIGKGAGISTVEQERVVASATGISVSGALLEQGSELAEAAAAVSASGKSVGEDKKGTAAAPDAESQGAKGGIAASTDEAPLVTREDMLTQKKGAERKGAERKE